MWPCAKKGSRLVFADGPACTLPTRVPRLCIVSALAVLLIVCLCRQSAMRHRRLRCRHAADEPTTSAHYYASSTFEGARPGYVFTTRQGRTGYYRDV